MCAKSLISMELEGLAMFGHHRRADEMLRIGVGCSAFKSHNLHTFWTTLLYFPRAVRHIWSRQASGPGKRDAREMKLAAGDKQTASVAFEPSREKIEIATG